MAFSTEMSNNLRHYLPWSWNPTEAGPSFPKAMCSVEHGCVSQDYIWYSQEIENCGCLDPITKQLTRNFRWLLISNKTAEDAAMWPDHEWAVRDTTLRDVNLRQSVCHLSLSWTLEGTKGGSFRPTEWYKRSILPTLAVHKNHRWQKMSLGWEGKERRRNSLRLVSKSRSSFTLVLQKEWPSGVVQKWTATGKTWLGPSGVWVPRAV